MSIKIGTRVRDEASSDPIELKKHLGCPYLKRERDGKFGMKYECTAEKCPYGLEDKNVSSN